MPNYPKLGFLDYVKAAYDVRINVAVLGSIPINKIFVYTFVLLGFINPGIWFLGLALELIYLWIMSSNHSFRRYVENNRLKVASQSINQKLLQLKSKLDIESSKRLDNLNSNISEISNLINLLLVNTPYNFTLDSRQQTLSQIPLMFLRLLLSKKVIIDSLQKTSIEKIKSEIKELENQLENPNISDSVKKSILGNIEIQNKRLENIKKAHDNLLLVENELKRIENQVQLIREEIALDRSPEAISDSFNRITSTLTETEAFVNSHTDIVVKLNSIEIIGG